MVSVRPPGGELGDVLKTISSVWYAAVPYLATIVILRASSGGRSRRGLAALEPDS